MRLYHLICITKRDEEIRERVVNNVLLFLKEKNVTLLSKEVFTHEVTKFRRYNETVASFLICKVELEESDIAALYSEIRKNVNDILVLRFILLSGTLENIPDRIME